MDDKKGFIDRALNEIEVNIGKIERKSDTYETAAWGKENQASFYNLAIKVKTKLSSTRLLKAIHTIEAKLGRKRIEHWGPRVIDIDIVFYKNDIVKTKDLIIPHQYMHERMFVLKPMMDIASHYTHPIFNKQIRTLYETCIDPLIVTIINE